MFKLILFDYDGVLTLDRTGSLTTCRFLGRITGLGTERLPSLRLPVHRQFHK